MKIIQRLLFALLFVALLLPALPTATASAAPAISEAPKQFPASASTDAVFAMYSPAWTRLLSGEFQEPLPDDLACPETLDPGVACTVMPDGSLRFDVAGLACDNGHNVAARAVLGQYGTGFTTYFSASYVQIETSNSDYNTALTDLRYLRFDGNALEGVSSPVTGSTGKSTQVSNGGYISTDGDSGVPESNATIIVIVGTDWPLTGCQITGTFYIATSPISICDTVIVKESNTYDIDPIIEFPQGAAPTPPAVADEQIATTVVGEWYRIRTTGQWDNGSAVIRGPEAHAFAYSLDGETWQGLETLPQSCKDSDGILWQSTAEEFHIRVDDVADEFADNTEVVDTELTYTLEAVDIAADCESDFTFDDGPESADLLVTLLAAGTDEAGAYTDLLTPTEWYVLETADGPWQADPDPGLDRYDMQGGFATGEVGGWFNIGDPHDLVQCAVDVGDNYKRVYVQAPTNYFRTRVADEDGQFGNNHGYMNLKIYHASYNRKPSACEGDYTLGDVMNIRDIDALQEQGAYVGEVAGPDEYSDQSKMTPGFWYAIHTYAGPWYYQGAGHGDGSMDEYDLEIYDGDSWKDLADWSGAACIAEIDLLGHLTVYFQVPENLTMTFSYRLRVNDTSFGGNGGGESFMLYRVKEGGQSGNCDTYSYDPDNGLIAQFTVFGNAVSGTAITSWMKQPGNVYAMHVIEGPWKEDTSGGDEWTMQMSNNNGSTWTELSLFQDFECFSTDPNGHDYTIYMRYNQGETWKMRVNSSTFSDNVGQRKVYLYTVTGGGNETCFLDKEKIKLWEDVEVNERSELGEYLGNPDTQPGVAPGIVYGLETKKDWTDNGVVSNMLQFSSDGGETWHDLDDHPNVTCSMKIVNQWMLEFHVDSGETWRIRVADGDDNFFNNAGAEGYIIYEVDDPDNPIDDFPGGFPDVIVDACALVIPTPTGIDPLTQFGIFIGAWVDFLRKSLLQYFAWCPRHTNALNSIPSIFYTREPFGTIKELQSISGETKKAIDGYKNQSIEGESDEFAPRSVLLPDTGTLALSSIVLPGLPENSPYNSGKITLYKPGPSYVTSCNKSIIPAIGRRLGQGICFGANMMYVTGASDVFQLILELVVLFGLVLYIWFAWIKPLNQ